MRIQSFEDLISWQKARALTKLVYTVSNAGGLARDFSLKDQMRRASVSVMSNIAEGFERGGDREFQQFLSQAKGSCAELRSQLFVALDQNYLSETLCREMTQLTLDVRKLISGMMNYLANSKVGGRKFKQPEKMPSTNPIQKPQNQPTLISKTPALQTTPPDTRPKTQDTRQPTSVSKTPALQTAPPDTRPKTQDTRQPTSVSKTPAPQTTPPTRDTGLKTRDKSATLDSGLKK